MSNDNGVYSQRLRAGKRRTYFFDVRSTKSEDFYITITESKKRYNDDGYDRHKIFLYKEDFNKFTKALENTVAHVKEELMPDYDFHEFDREPEEFRKGEGQLNNVADKSVNEYNQEVHSQKESFDAEIMEEDLSF